MALNDIPSKRFKPKAPTVKFNWVGDPADRLRGKGDAITGDQSQSMLAFNRNLTEPLDRGGGSAIRINGAPVSLAGTGTQSIGRQQPWQQTTSAQAAAIAARYSAPPNPNLTAIAVPSVPTSTSGQITPPLETLADPANPNTLEYPAAPNPHFLTEGSTIPSPGQLRDPGGPLATDRAPIPPPGTLDSQGNPIAPPTMLTGFDPSHGREDTAEANGGDGPGAPLKNPHSGASVADKDLQNWLSSGGSVATFHRQQVAEGLRAPIDAHATPSQANSTASTELRNQMGFGSSPQADSTAISGQMTQDFDKNHAVGQDAWQKRFGDAHTALMKSLSMDQ